MRVYQKLLGTGAMGAMLLTAACTTNPETGNQRLSKAAIGGVAGAVGGYFLGDLIGGRGDRTEKIVGAGIGAVAGAGIGAYMDSQEKKLREETAGTGVDVIRERSEEHTSELQSLMRISYAVFCLKKKKRHNKQHNVMYDM